MSTKQPLESLTRIGIAAKPQRGEIVGRLLEELVPWLEERGITVHLDTAAGESFDAAKNVVERSVLPTYADLIVVLGGDGTLLNVARHAAPAAIPILGVNLGSLGFLAEVTLDETFIALERVFRGDYGIEERTMLTCVVERNGEKFPQLPVVNDVVINKGALARIVELETYVDDQYVTTYRADGLIVSTPTGSTAYSMSAGGPVVHPIMPSLILTPICPFTLANRPIVVPDTGVIKVTLRTREEDVLISLDGQHAVFLMPEDTVEIRKAESNMLLLNATRFNFYEVLRKKLRWGEQFEQHQNEPPRKQ